MPHYSIRRFLKSVAILSIIIATYFSVKYVYLPQFISLTPIENGWIVYNLPTCSPCAESILQDGDKIIAIGEVNYEANAYIAPFADYSGGEIVQLKVIRDDKERAVTLEIPAETNSQRLSKLLIVVFWMPFWLCGVWLALFAPVDSKSSVMSLLFLFYAVWMAAGLVSSAFVPGASVVVHVATWLLVPLSIHVHWIFPHTLRWRVPKPLAVLLYALFGLLVVAELLQIMPRQVFSIGTVLMVVTPFGLLAAHKNRGYLHAKRLMLMGIITLTIPLITWLIISFVSTGESGISTISLILAGGAALLALPVFPLLYVYANYRQHFPAVIEQRLWGSLVMLVYISVMLVAITAAITMAGAAFALDDEAVSLSLITSTVIAIAVALGTNSAQSWMRRFTYGDFDANIARASAAFSSQMTELSGPGELEAFLAGSIHEALEVRASALYLVGSGLLRRFATEGVTAPDILSPNDELIAQLGQYRPSDSSYLPWVQLSIPLLVQQQLVGVWLLGARENDDFYAASHIERIQSLGNQIAAVVEMRRQQREIERQVAAIVVKEKEAALGRVVTSVAHQFRNPLQVIMGALEADNDYKRPDKEWLTVAYERAEKLSDVVRSIQRFARPSNGDNGLKVVLDVTEAIDEAMILITQRMKEAGISIVREEMAGLTVAMGESELTQVILNLLENASEAQQGGEVIIKTSRQDGRVTLSVEDQGMGIAERDLEQIFEPLYTTKHSLGLGLWITRSIIDRNGGNISVKSSLGKGSVFTIKLPKPV